MAGDWIKIETSTPDKPEIVSMANLLRISEDAVVGKLIRVWAWADINSIAGASVPITGAFIDRLVGKKGFAESMRSAGWLTGQDGALSFPNFERHNGKSAKARSTENRRKAKFRSGHKQDICPTTHRDTCPENVPHETGQTPDKNRGPEKRREEIYNTPIAPSFEKPSAGGVEPEKSDGQNRTEQIRLPEPLSEDFRPHWIRWIRHVSEAFHFGREIPLGTVEQHLHDCAKLGQERAIAAIEHTIAIGTLRRLVEQNGQANKQPIADKTIILCKRGAPKW